eukprot:COSAG06_NODE_16033_length_1027_cov_1.860991_1_plen_127_part_10
MLRPLYSIAPGLCRRPLRDVRTLLQASHAACALLFAPAAGAKHRFRAWQAVLQGRHPALESLEFDALEEVEAPSAAATDDDDDGDDDDDKYSERHAWQRRWHLARQAHGAVADEVARAAAVGARLEV